MTETDWFREKYPGLLYDYVRVRKENSRKSRLLTCAGCRRAWSQLTDPVLREAVELAERFADGAATQEELTVAEEQVVVLLHSQPGLKNIRQCTPHETGPWLAWGAVRSDAESGPAMWGGWASQRTVPAAERRAMCDLLREIYGNPFRTHPVATEYLTWQGGVVTQLANAIYEGRRFSDLPILADALEEAGCVDAEILRHCRRPGGHVRGCWVLDTLLGLEGGE
jgi:hypothetical protein